MKYNFNHQDKVINLLGLLGVTCLVITFFFGKVLTLVGLSIAAITWIMLGVNKLLFDTNQTIKKK